MTNADKFKEVFGFWPNAGDDESICNSVFCEDTSCDGCRYSGRDHDNSIVCWGDEYKEQEDENTN